MKIWGQEISRNLEKELALCRGFIPYCAEDDDFNLNSECVYRPVSPHQKKYSDSLAFKELRTILNANNSQIVDVSKFSWLDPLKKHSYGFSSFTDFCGFHEATFINFIKCRFGARVPVVLLDPGIALFVRTLPLVGVLTTYSCSGHLKDSPHVGIRGDYHLQWLRCILLAIFDCDEVELSSKHRIDLQNGATFQAEPFCEESHFKAYWKAQSISRFLLNRTLLEKVREIKFQFCSEEELFDTVVVTNRIKAVLQSQSKRLSAM